MNRSLISKAPGRHGRLPQGVHVNWLSDSKRDRSVRAAVALVTAALAWVATRAVLKACNGEPALALDDSYIHLNFASAIARGAPLAYTPGAPPVPGSTSWLWPALLAPFLSLGLTDSAAIWPAWVLGWCAHGLLAWEVYALSERLFGMPVRLGLTTLCLGFGAHLWFATSGMEVMPFAWLLARTSRRAAEWGEGTALGSRDKARELELLLLAWLAPLARPEGVLATALVAFSFFCFPRARRFAQAGPWLALAGAVAPSALNLCFSSEVSTTTQTVKWLPFNPYLRGTGVLSAIVENASVLFFTLLNGEIWSAEFLPEHSGPALWLSLPAALLLGVLRGQTWRACCVLVIGFGLFLPTSYDTFLWNRLRYLWPFFFPWLLGVAAEVELVALGLGLMSRRLSAVAWVVGLGALVAVFERVPGCLSDVAESSAAIRLQQVSLGRWAKRELPETARIGVNDAGALAYFSGRRTFDIVGLTTRGEARYWVAGAGSRFEHYERLSPADLPTHFVVYPDWMGLPSLLGRELTSREVPWGTILGGTTMTAYEADYRALGSAEAPLEPAYQASVLLDRLDVADLESELEHAYELGEATQLQNRVAIHPAGTAVDGGRWSRTSERFELALEPGARLIARLGADLPVELSISIDGAQAGRVRLEASPWQELELPTGTAVQAHTLRRPTDSKRVTLESTGEFSALHYFSVRR